MSKSRQPDPLAQADEDSVTVTGELLPQQDEPGWVEETFRRVTTHSTVFAGCAERTIIEEVRTRTKPPNA